ncbi:hypothetical protein IMZ48_08865 [Candidatus Bathyarchaeota archaeon]|nr:hypothetical protein [Candidatus Bathyarchaeota archaeon]
MSSIAETTTQQPSGFVQGLIAQMILGHQTETVKGFLSLSATERTTFTGWSMDGWVRWLSGLRGAYERRMTRMCDILDAGKDRIRDVAASRTTVVVHKTPRLSFAWPRGGMFAWVQVHLENHPLFEQEGLTMLRFTGQNLADALLMFLTKVPYKVLAAPGRMFAATQDVSATRAWRYFRLCFAAETEDRVDDCSRMFVRGVADFFEIDDILAMEKLVEEAKEE